MSCLDLEMMRAIRGVKVDGLSTQWLVTIAKIEVVAVGNDSDKLFGKRKFVAAVRTEAVGLYWGLDEVDNRDGREKP